MSKLITTILKITGVFIAFFGVLFLFSNIQVSSFEKSKKIDEMFTSVAANIDEYYEKHGKYPSSARFVSLRGNLSQYGIYGQNLHYYTADSLPSEFVEEFGEPIKPTYALAVWRGEWLEVYAGWVNKSTLPKKLSEYYFTGNKFGDFIVIILFAGIFYLSPYFVKMILNKLN